MHSTRTTRSAPATAPFRAAEHLLDNADIALYLEEMLGDGDMRAVPVALRSVTDALGGVNALSEKTGVSRSTIYRALSDKRNARLDTLAAILAAFGLRLSIRRAAVGGSTAERLRSSSPARPCENPGSS